MKSPSRSRIVPFVILVASLIGMPALLADELRPGAASGAQRHTTNPVSPTEAAAWREDLRVLVNQLERIHPDPYWQTSKAEFDDAVERLHDAIPKMAAHQIIVAFARILALVGNGHTSLPLHSASGVDFHILPYRLGVYDDGIHVEGADRQYAVLVGGRLIAIGEVSAAEILERVGAIISKDNPNWIAAVAPHLLNRIEVLQALGATDGLDQANLRVERNGEILTIPVQPLAEPQPTGHGLPFLPRYTSEWVDARDGSGAPPLTQRRFDDLYWWEYDQAVDRLYVKWDQVQNRESGPTALATFREAMAFARENHPAKTVIDIRNNTGGEGGLLPPIIREIVRTREVDEPGKLFLVIGRRTFSAGQMMTGMLEQFSTAILVGEPSSAYYNGYAGHTTATLPHSGITFLVSPDYYQMGAYPRDPRQQATPRLAAVPTFADYVANRDPALDVIDHYDPHAADRLAHDALEALSAGDEAGAARLVQEYDARPVNRFFDSASALNARGYLALRQNHADEAINLFELNVLVHPGYANGWDSLGEAYVRANRQEDAIEAFRKALALQPDLASAKAWLHRLESMR